MRLFVAVDLDSQARAAVAALVDELRRDPGFPASDFRWVNTDLTHVTLRFIGQVDAQRAALLAERLTRPYPVSPFEVALGGLGVFPPAGRVRILWLGVSDGAAAVEALHAEVGRRLDAAGETVESRPFTPHITLARAQGAMRSAIRSRLRGLPAATVARWRVARVTLYDSRPGPSGVRYHPMASGELGG